MLRTTTRLRLPLALAATLIALSACADATGTEEHLDAYGFAIVEGESEIYRSMDQATPALELVQGAYDVAFVLLDADGLPIEEADADEDHEHELDITIGNGSVLTWTAEEHDHEHEHIEFHGELDALMPGTTTLSVCVPHGSHCDFDVQGIPVTVTAP